MARTRWTEEHQTQAEALRADGLSYPKIADILGCAQSTVYNRLNPVCQEQRRLDSRRYRRENPLKVKATKRKCYLAGDREARLARAREWSNNNRSKVAGNNGWQSTLRRARKAVASGRISQGFIDFRIAQAQEDLPKIKALYARVRAYNSIMNADARRDGHALVVDHIIPLGSTFDLRLSNLQVMTRDENIAKGSTITFDV